MICASHPRPSLVLKTIGKCLRNGAIPIGGGGLHRVRKCAGRSQEVCRDGGALLPDGCRPGAPMLLQPVADGCEWEFLGEDVWHGGGMP